MLRCGGYQAIDCEELGFVSALLWSFKGDRIWSSLHPRNFYNN